MPPVIFIIFVLLMFSKLWHLQSLCLNYTCDSILNFDQFTLQFLLIILIVNVLLFIMNFNYKLSPT